MNLRCFSGRLLRLILRDKPLEKEFYRRAASFVDKIFKGAKPGDLPIEQPTRFNLVINRKTADAIGLTIPPQLYVFADDVVE